MKAKDTSFYPKKTLKIKGKLIPLDTPIVMGILNLTPDSFYDGGKLKSDQAFMQLAEKHVNDGAAILDVGGYSTRPGADDITENQELKRINGMISKLNNYFPDIALSIDTFRPKVAGEAISQGAQIVNDTSGGCHEMYDLVARHKVAYILMHNKGTPKTMQFQTQYDDLLHEMMHFFEIRIQKLFSYKVSDIIIDPGIGFAKELIQNFVLLNNLSEFQFLNLPILVGLSRKSLIYKSLDITAAESLNGTTALHTVSLLRGASILRVHDVKEAVQTIKLMDLVMPKN